MMNVDLQTLCYYFMSFLRFFALLVLLLLSGTRAALMKRLDFRDEKSVNTVKFEKRLRSLRTQEENISYI